MSDCELGSGGYSTVYEHELRSGKRVAVKVCVNNNYILVPESFIKEVCILKMLRHRNVISMKRFGLAGKDSFYITMPLALTDLHKWVLAGESYSILDYSCQIAQGLDYIIDRGILTLDLKPQNILVFSDGTLKLADFGISSPRGGHIDPHLTYTFWYKAPELLLGFPCTHKAESWAYGCVVYFLAKRKHCFSSCSSTGLLRSMIEYFGPPSDWGSTTPKTIQDIIVRVPLTLTGDSVIDKIITSTLVMDHNSRISVRQVLEVLDLTPYTNTNASTNEVCTNEVCTNASIGVLSNSSRSIVLGILDEANICECIVRDLAIDTVSRRGYESEQDIHICVFIVCTLLGYYDKYIDYFAEGLTAEDVVSILQSI